MRPEFHALSRSSSSQSMAGRVLFWLESALAAACSLLVALTLVWRDWIEALTGVDLDHHTGSLEWLVVATLAISAIGLSLLARREWRRLHPRAVG
jgi:hypothetical protein